MKSKIQRYFGITDKGMKNVIIASRFSFLKFLSFTFAPTLVFKFLQDYLNGELKSLTIYMAIFTVLIILTYLILAKEYTLNYDVTYEESAALRINMANKFKELPLSYFSKHNLSDLSQTVMMDVNNVEMVMSHSIPQGLGFLYFFILISVIMIATNPPLGMAVVVPIWLAIILMLLTKKIQVKHISKYYYRLLENSATFQEAFEMQEEIKSYSLQDKIEEDVSKRLEDTERVHIKSEFVMAIISSLIGILPYTAPVFTAVIGAVLYSANSLDILYYLGYLMAATTLSSQYAGVSQYILMAFFFEDSFKRINELQEEEIQKGIDVKIDHFNVKFDDVHFAYGQNKVINGVSFEAKQGEVTALVGPSGCGKTTILRLISRLYDYDSGEIIIGGHDIKKISTKTLFENISIVFQNVELFNKSIFENVRIGRKNASDEEVMEAIKLANVDKFAENLPDGYDTIIGENGSKLSGGERQRISIARAFLKNAPIILLDEISASIDVENEMEIQKSINKLITNKTVIVISHRIKSIENANKIIVVNNGEIDNEGSHQELLKKSKIYQSMVEKSELTEKYVY